MSEPDKEANAIASRRTRRRPPVRAFLAIVLAGIETAALAGCRETSESPIKNDEYVTFFPTYGHLSEDGSTWTIHVHGWIYEPERDSPARIAGMKALREWIGIDDSQALGAIFEERARPFIVDSESGKRIPFRFADAVYRTGVSELNGHFRGTVRLPAATIERLSASAGPDDGWLRFEALTRHADPRVFEGRVQLIEPTGYSVVSDIDDTIKISNVADEKELLVNTFLRKFEAVPGMARLYQSWASVGARFHYVSASPWQLYGPLSDFIESADFPAGSFHLRDFNLADGSALDLLASPESEKREKIGSILRAFPQRRFILVGDSGQKDPEVYGALARAQPQQVVEILIRDVTGEDRDAPRYQTAFAGVDEERWKIFRDAETVTSSVP